MNIKRTPVMQMAGVFAIYFRSRKMLLLPV